MLYFVVKMFLFNFNEVRLKTSSKFTPTLYKLSPKTKHRHHQTQA